jgi:hypothetical protein
MERKRTYAGVANELKFPGTGLTFATCNHSIKISKKKITFFLLERKNLLTVIYHLKVRSKTKI